MTRVSSPPTARIPLSTVFLGGRQTEIFLTPEWQRFFEDLTRALNGNTGIGSLSDSVARLAALPRPVFLDDGGGGGGDGDMGPPGPPGPPGAAGAAGQAGVTMVMDGADGDDGMPGAPGQPGQPGPAGPTGPLGPAVFMEADPGEEGQPGPPGLPGIAGPAGAVGATGPAVFMEADPGEEGPQGPPGLPGQQGATGPAGARGLDGVAMHLLAPDPSEIHDAPLLMMPSAFVNRAQAAPDLRGWTFLGSATGAAVTVGPVVWTGTYQQIFFQYLITGYSGGTPVGRILCGAASISTTALTNGNKLISDVTANATSVSVPGCPLAVTLSNIARSGYGFIMGASGALKQIHIHGVNGNPAAATSPTSFLANSFFSDLGTNLPIQRLQLTSYDTLVATAASVNTFTAGTTLWVWGRNND